MGFIPNFISFSYCSKCARFCFIDDIQYEDLAFGAKLAKGVHEVTFKKGNYKGDVEAAAKCIMRYGKSPPLLKEVSIMKDLKHPNIVRFIDFVPGPPSEAPGTPNPYYIVMEKGKCSLDSYLESPDNRLEEPLQNKWANEVAEAIRYLHDKDIVHRDIKPANCLIFPELVLKVSDFGISCEGDGTKQTSNKRGTGKYRAPEVVTYGTYSKASDVWALGILLWHIYARRKDYSSSSHLPTIGEDFPPIVKELLPRCWETDPHNRPDIDKIVQDDLRYL